MSWRGFVAGYRQPRLESELQGARQLLEAAGIDVRLKPIIETLPPETSAVLAWMVCEGVANVIWHSRVQHCLIRLTQKNGRVWAEVINDGGRQERMEAGPLTLSGKEHFRVRVELPIQRGGEAPVLQEERS